VLRWGSENLVKTSHTNECERFKRKENQTKPILPSLDLSVGSVCLCLSCSLLHSLTTHQLGTPPPLNMEGYTNTRLQTRPMIKCRQTDM
jgi:hypothetical protein